MSLPDYKDQMRSQSRTVVADLVRTDDNSGDERHVSVESNETNGTNPRDLDYKDQVRPHAPPRVVASEPRLAPDHIEASPAVWPEYKHQMMDYEGPTASASDATGARTVVGNVVSDTPSDSIPSYTTSNGTNLPDYKHQMQDVPAAHVSSPETTESVRPNGGASSGTNLPDYKHQMQDAPSARVSTPETTESVPSNVGTSNGTELPDYKDQIQDVPSARVASPPPSTREPTRSDPNVGPDYKAQVQYRTAPSPPAEVSNPASNPHSDSNPSLPHYKDQVLERDGHRDRTHPAALPPPPNGPPPSGPMIPRASTPPDPVDVPPPEIPMVKNLEDETNTEPTDDRVSVAVAEPYHSVLVVAADDAVALQAHDNHLFAVGHGVLIDTIYEEQPEPLEPDVSTEKAVPEPKWIQKHKTVWMVGLLMALLGAIIVGGVCGSGNCRRAGTAPLVDTAAADTGSTLTPSTPELPMTARGTLPYFTSTNELYQVVDAYVNAMYYDNSTDSQALRDDLVGQYGDIANWDVSRVTDFSLVFYRGDRSTFPMNASLVAFVPPRTLFDEDIGGWNVSAATTLAGMLAGAANFTHSLSKWDTSRVTNMRGLFHSASAFDDDLGSWSVGSVTDFAGTFWGCSSLRGTELASWDTGAARDMSGMLARTTSLVTDLSLWDVGEVTTMDYLFFGSTFTGDLSLWNTSRVEIMSSTFRQAASFTGDISTWDTSRVTTMASMFLQATAFNGNLEAWNTEQVTDMRSMFEEAAAFNTNLPWDVSRVTVMASMFSNTLFNGAISTWDTSSCRDMNNMFSSCRSFKGDISTWNTGRVVDMSNMLINVLVWFVVLVELAIFFDGNLSQWDVSSVKDTQYMFKGADYFNSDVSSWNVTSISVMSSMFQDAKIFNQSLCAWMDRLNPEASVTVVWESIFAGSACLNTDEPYNSTVGPWCHNCTTSALQ